MAIKVMVNGTLRDATANEITDIQDRASVLAKELANTALKNQINALKSGQVDAVRKAILTGDKTDLQAVDAQIATLNAQLLP